MLVFCTENAQDLRSVPTFSVTFLFEEKNILLIAQINTERLLWDFHPVFHITWTFKCKRLLLSLDTFRRQGIRCWREKVRLPPQCQVPAAATTSSRLSLGSHHRRSPQADTPAAQSEKTGSNRISPAILAWLPGLHLLNVPAPAPLRPSHLPTSEHWNPQLCPRLLPSPHLPTSKCWEPPTPSSHFFSTPNSLDDFTQSHNLKNQVHAKDSEMCTSSLNI